LVHGVVVLNVREPAEKVRQEASRGGRDALMCYWGFSFEEACTGGSYSEPIDCMDAFITVVRTGVGQGLALVHYSAQRKHSLRDTLGA